MIRSQSNEKDCRPSESTHIGFYYDLHRGMVVKSGGNYVDMNETYLRMQGDLSHPDTYEYMLSRQNEPLIRLNTDFIHLKLSLRKLPEAISSIHRFQQVLDDVGQAMKKFFETLEEVFAIIPGLNSNDKTELARIKRYFRNQFYDIVLHYINYHSKVPVFTFAAHVSFYSNQIMSFVKHKCENK